MSRIHPPELLLDTHALLWWLADPDRLSPAAHGAIEDPGNRVHVSAASGWEIATKVRLGKLPAANELLDDLPQLIAAQGLNRCRSPLGMGSMLAATPWPIETPSIGSSQPSQNWEVSPW